MLEPQSTLFFALLVITFGVLIWWLIITRRVALRVLAACLAFIPAMMFGIAAVNMYYGYYRTWGAAIADLTNKGPSAVEVDSPAEHGITTTGVSADGQAHGPARAATDGLTVKLAVTDQAIDITRTVYVYLPPQYFQPAYRSYQFPAIELMHGFPSTPQDWMHRHLRTADRELRIIAQAAGSTQKPR